MASKFNNKVSSTLDSWIADDDAREILAIAEPGTRLNPKTGELLKQAALQLEGPNGGKFWMSVPGWYWNQYADQIQLGMGFSGGWKAGRFIGTIWTA